ncbi:MAG: thioredoxin family protein [Syntrophales bacterium]|nr:thioredoxin family protein [Syntrophales bacterium]
MTKDEVTQIRINNNLIGIVGLDAVMADMADAYGDRADGEVGGEMIRRLEAKNYIPVKARPLYAAALAREFHKFLGRPVEEVSHTGLRVAVLGPGCAQCDRMETDIREVMTEMRLAAELNHVTEMREIASYGVMGLPALVINDQVVCVGQAPNRNKIREWLQAAVGS